MLKLPLSLLRKSPAAPPPRDAEMRFRTAVEHAPLGLACAGTDGTWLYLNDRFREIVGYTREQLARLTFTDITHPDDAKIESVLVRRLIAGDVPRYRLEKRIIERRGKYREVVVSASIVHGPSGEAELFVYVVDEVQRSANGARTGDQTVANVLDRMTALAIVRTDDKGTITGWNAGAERLFGYARAEVLGKPRRMLFRDRDNWDGGSTKQLQAASDSGAIELDDWRVAKDGRHLWVRSSTMAVERDGVVRGYVEVIGPAGGDAAVAQQARLSGEARTQELKRNLEELRQELERREDVEQSLRGAIEQMRVAGEETMNELRIMTGALRKEIERRKEAEAKLSGGQALMPVPESVEEPPAPVTPRPRSWKRLGDKAPAELLIAHGAEGKSGTLVLASGVRQLEIFFENGKVFSVSSNDPTRFLTQRLIAQRVISENQRQRALEIQRETHLALGRILLILGAISEEQLVDAIRAKAEEEIGLVLTWHDVRYAFVEGEIPALQLVPLRIDVTELVVAHLDRGERPAPLAEELRSIDAELPRIAEELEDVIEIPPPPPPPRPATDLLVASANAKKFHRPTCAAVRRVDEDTRLLFTRIDEAEEAGYEACRICFR